MFVVGVGLIFVFPPVGIPLAIIGFGLWLYGFISTHQEAAEKIAHDDELIKLIRAFYGGVPLGAYVIAVIAVQSIVPSDVRTAIGAMATGLFLLQAPFMFAAVALFVRSMVAAVLLRCDYRMWIDDAGISAALRGRASHVGWKEITGLAFNRWAPLFVVYRRGRTPLRLWLVGLGAEKVRDIRSVLCSQARINPREVSGLLNSALAVVALPEGVHQPLWSRIWWPGGAVSRGARGSGLASGANLRALDRRA